MKVLLLKNYPSASPADKATVQSYRDNIRRSVPAAHIDICCIANGDTIPDTSKYELVILSGGRVNLLGNDKPQWALDVLGMIRRVAGDGSTTKLLGICWGHQAIHYALGGKLAWLDSPRVRIYPRDPEQMNHPDSSQQLADNSQIGVQKIELNPEGQNLFQRNTLVRRTPATFAYTYVRGCPLLYCD